MDFDFNNISTEYKAKMKEHEEKLKKLMEEINLGELMKSIETKKQLLELLEEKDRQEKEKAATRK